MSDARRRVAVAAVAVLVLGGCGGGSAPAPPDAQRVRQVIRDYLTRQAAGDSAAACALVSTAGQRQLVAFVTLQARARHVPIGGLHCVGAIDLLRVVAGAATLTELKTARVTDVRVTGPRATAVLHDGAVARREVVELERTNGAWLIRAVPAIGH